MRGKEIRLSRIFRPLSGRTVITPLDHGVTQGPIQGLSDLSALLPEIAKGGADAAVLHQGSVECLPPGTLGQMGLILHISASTILSPDPVRKVSVSSVEQALHLGADAVSFHLNLGNPYESEMIRDLGLVASDCFKWGMPLMVMAYLRGPGVENGRDPQVVAHAARMAAELGADFVKVDYTGDTLSFKKVTLGCPVPVVIAGGSAKGDEKAALEMVHGALQGGARGVSIGRNVFQSKSPANMVRAFSALVHRGATVEQTQELLK